MKYDSFEQNINDKTIKKGQRMPVGMLKVILSK